MWFRLVDRPSVIDLSEYDWVIIDHDEIVESRKRLMSIYNSNADLSDYLNTNVGCAGKIIVNLPNKNEQVLFALKHGAIVEYKFDEIS